jgi:phosphoglycerol geranylgeranyltransferase
MIRMVKDVIDVPLIVGGGIRSRTQVRKIVDAGADMVVTGNITEQGTTRIRLKELIGSVRRK